MPPRFMGMWDGFEARYSAGKFPEAWFKTYPHIPSDSVVYSHFLSSDNALSGSYKVFFSGENEPVDQRADMYMTWHRDPPVVGKPHMRCPLWALHRPCARTLVGETANSQSRGLSERPFCSYVQSHDIEYRDDFVRVLGQLGPVASPGRCLNNRPYLHYLDDDNQYDYSIKIDFLSRYKFNVCFENSQADGYCTEKIVQAFAAGSIPIYWGDPYAYEYFDTKSFVHHKSDDEATMDHVRQLHGDPEVYYEMLNCGKLTPYGKKLVYN